MKYDLSKREKSVPYVRETGEFLTSTQKLIVRLKAVKEARKLSIPDIDTMINHAVSRSTLYRFFEDESELNYNFDYQYTILPIQNALLVEDTLISGDEIAKEKVAGFEAALQAKDDTLKLYERRIEQIKAEHEKICQEYEARLTLWQHQVEKKDDRMDRKDRILDQKDEEIRQLRARIDQLTDQLLKGEKNG